MKSGIFFTLLMLIAGAGYAQNSKNIYTTTSGELIFSFANINYKGDETGSIMRFSPVVNLQNWINIDKSENFGWFSGLSVRNVGFIYEPPDQTGIKKKYRTYNIGVPIGIKVGNLSKSFLFGGYELELPVNFKEKTFENENKTKNNVWFSKQVTTFQHSLMLGVQLPHGATLKFKYYLSNFFNKDYTRSDGSKPYQNSDYNIFYFSLNFGLLKNTDFYYNND